MKLRVVMMIVAVVAVVAVGFAQVKASWLQAKPENVPVLKKKAS